MLGANTNFIGMPAAIHTSLLPVRFPPESRMIGLLHCVVPVLSTYMACFVEVPARYPKSLAPEAGTAPPGMNWVVFMGAGARKTLVAILARMCIIHGHFGGHHENSSTRTSRRLQHNCLRRLHLHLHERWY